MYLHFYINPLFAEISALPLSTVGQGRLFFFNQASPAIMAASAGEAWLNKNERPCASYLTSTIGTA